MRGCREQRKGREAGSLRNSNAAKNLEVDVFVLDRRSEELKNSEVRQSKLWSNYAPIHSRGSPDSKCRRACNPRTAARTTGCCPARIHRQPRSVKGANRRQRELETYQMPVNARNVVQFVARRDRHDQLDDEADERERARRDCEQDRQDARLLQRKNPGLFRAELLRFQDQGENARGGGDGGCARKTIESQLSVRLMLCRITHRRREASR